MLTLTNVFTKMMNFKNVFRWHLPFLLLLGLFSLRAVAADTLLILGDSLSAGYRLPIERAGRRCWPNSGRKTGRAAAGQRQHQRRHRRTGWRVCPRC